jgi:catechol 2,3-dioxygenase-like lactoylglutathione lyase family enzyme
VLRTFGLTHTALPVADLDRSIKFYQSLLGAEVRYRTDDAADIGTPGCHDVITLQRTQDAPTGDMGALGHIGFRLRQPEDLQALTDAVVAAGGAVSDTGHFTPDEPYVFAKDPDGYLIELWYEP